ncbi:MAG: hypothetical protein WDZ29_07185 [Balneolaceae bacterium]
MKQKKTLLHFLFVVLLIGNSCSSNDRFVPESFNLPHESTHRLVERFRISQPSPEVFFSTIAIIHILRDGNIVVRNYPEYHLIELNPDGEVVEVISRSGRGPGELLQATISFLTKDDSLHIRDAMSRRHLVLAKNEQGEWEVARERVAITVVDGERVEFIPGRLISGSDHEDYGLFSIYPGQRDTLTKHYTYVAHVDVNLTRKSDPSRIQPVEDLAIHRTDNSITVSNNNRFFEAFYQYDPVRDEVMYITNTSNEIIGIDSSGDEFVKGYLPFERFQPDDSDIERSMENSTYYYRGMESIIRDKLLPHEPYYRKVILDEERLWIQFSRSDTTQPNWMITTTEGNITATFIGPGDIERVQIRGQRMYGSVEGSDGTVYLVGYELTE